MTKTRQQLFLVIADSHPIFLEGLRSVLRAHPDIKIVAQCRDGLEVMEKIRKFSPDVALIEISMPGLNGLDILAKVTAEGLPTRIMFLTTAATDTQAGNAIAGGASGIIFRNSSPEGIARSVRKVAAGKYHFPKDLVAAMRGRQSKHRKIAHWPYDQLTPREAEVTRLMIKGLRNREIGQQLDLSEGTVKIHLHNIFKKLGVANRTSLAALIVGR